MRDTCSSCEMGGGCDPIGMWLVYSNENRPGVFLWTCVCSSLEFLYLCMCVNGIGVYGYTFKCVFVCIKYVYVYVFPKTNSSASSCTCLPSSSSRGKAFTMAWSPIDRAPPSRTQPPHAHPAYRDHTIGGSVLIRVCTRGLRSRVICLAQLQCAGLRLGKVHKPVIETAADFVPNNGKR